jgi:hypothetical protein
MQLQYLILSHNHGWAMTEATHLKWTTFPQFDIFKRSNEEKGVNQFTVISGQLRKKNDHADYLIASRFDLDKKGYM